ncbi:MAG: hypothetical protein GX167_02445 [Firmicutes bacterium]|nr:hypothetical protein [Bacillota bacterium]
MIVAKRIVPGRRQEELTRPREVVRPRPRLTVAWKLKMLSFVLACALASVALLSHYLTVVDLSRQIELAAAELAALQEENKHLELEIASLRAPERVEAMAFEMGMQYPGREQMIILKAEARPEQ